MRTFDTVADFCAAVGQHLGDSAWMAIDQDRINLFADATDDHQWIHVDPERAAASPLGSTIAHGFLTLSLLPALTTQVFEIKHLTMALNYGSNRVRFVRPVPVDSRIQARVTLASIEEAPLGFRATLNVEVHLEDGGKPAVIAELITLIVGE